MSLITVWIWMCVCVGDDSVKSFKTRLHPPPSTRPSPSIPLSPPLPSPPPAPPPPTPQTHNVTDHDSSYSVETLLDAAMVLYDECCTSSFKKEKTVSEFVAGGTFQMMPTAFCTVAVIPIDSMNEDRFPVHVTFVLPPTVKMC